ncbi:MAG: hypothetical protein VCB25_02680, partial [Myxococcota bacterium]
VAANLPKRIFFESSFSFALLQHSSLALLLGLASVMLAIWLFSSYGQGEFTWAQIDEVGGLRWPIFLVAMTLAWAYAGYRYNYYFDQAHLWDRWLIVALMLGTLRSPLFLPLFAFEVLMSRAQFNHPISAIVPIGDELPLRIMGAVVGCAVWNGLADAVAAVRSRGQIKQAVEKRLQSIRIPTHALVYTILCLVGFYYAVAGIGKLKIGTDVLDWLMFSHMENLFISSHLNGWLSSLSEGRVLDFADMIRTLHLPIAGMTLAIELGAALILVRRRGTLLILAAISLMHFGIVLTSGVIFWKWLVLDLSLLVWLWVQRGNPEINRMYSTSYALLSIFVIGMIVAVFNLNQFAWWNTKWTMLYEVEVLDEAGNVYRVDHADFAPYTFFDLYLPDDRKLHTYVLGMTVNQRLMEFFEDPDPERLKAFGVGIAGEEAEPRFVRGDRVFKDFMTRYFMHRNRHPSQRVAPFLWPSPSMHNRFLIGPDLYRDQSPVAEVRLRFQEIYYTGSELRTMRDQIVYSTLIPAPISSPNALHSESPARLP